MTSTRKRRGWVWPVATLVLVALAAVAGWAASVVLRPVEDPTTATAYTYVTVEPGEVGSSMRLNVVAKWEPTPVGTNQASGIVTDVVAQPGDVVSQGDVLYRVNLRPVVVASGETPAFRAIGFESRGADVAQLQQLLTDVGMYFGAVDGDAGAGTVEAIRDWQESLGLARTGTVELGDVIFVPSLPTRVTLDAEVIARGSALTGGEDVVQSLAGSPDVFMPVTEAQSAMIPVGTEVQITSPSSAVWAAVAGERTTDPMMPGTVIVGIEGTGDGALCGDQCDEIPVTGDFSLPSQVVTVPQTQGLVVPSAALISDASGQTAVVAETGERIPVTVIAYARGMSVIEGMDQGLRVRVPAQDGGAAQ